MDPSSFFDDLPTHKDFASCVHYSLSRGVDEVVMEASGEHLEIFVRRERIDSEDIQLINPLFRPARQDFFLDVVAGCGFGESAARKRKNSTQSIDDPNLLKDFRVP